MPRFFLETPPQGDRAEIRGDDAHHIAKALRMQPGEMLTLCDGAGQDYDGVLESVDTARVTVRVTGQSASAGESDIRVTLFMALPKADKMELIVQKATELGVDTIVPYLSAHCVSRPDERAMDKKCARWAKIAIEAAKQCGRGRLPAVQPVASMAEAIRQAAEAETALLLYEAEREQSFRAALQAKKLTTVSVMVGPEGGFAPEEVHAAMQAGLQSVSLGTRILRCETAPIAALAAVQYESGNL